VPRRAVPLLSIMAKPSSTRRTRSSSSNRSTAAPASPPVDAAAVRGELTQLAVLRAAFPALSPAASSTFHALHDDDACRERGNNTRATDTFRIAMTWARTFGAHAADPALDGAQVRWFLDCLTGLGAALTGRAPAANPSHGGALADAEHVADRLLQRTERRARDAAGSRADLTAALDAALTPDGALDSRVSRLRQLAGYLEAQLRSGAPHAAALRLFHLDTPTVTALRGAADTLDSLIASVPPPKQIDRDSPQVNTAEGRLFFAMRPLWDGLAEAREDGVTSLLLTVSPTLLRGLNIKPDRKPAATKA
jgi:hypothetical protein